ncbi:MAG: hypothetical protein DRJ42_20980 [Deltaproteobacteria bacterium]|nr:MAG: hypothetical protein DRJ42_20980 [Deltaproteobacteria bacterium]
MGAPLRCEHAQDARVCSLLAGHGGLVFRQESFWWRRHRRVVKCLAGIQLGSLQHPRDPGPLLGRHPFGAFQSFSLWREE